MGWGRGVPGKDENVDAIINENKVHNLHAASRKAAAFSHSAPDVLAS